MPWVACTCRTSFCPYLLVLVIKYPNWHTFKSRVRLWIFFSPNWKLDVHLTTHVIRNLYFYILSLNPNTSFLTNFHFSKFCSFLNQLQDYVEYMGSGARVLLVPSTRDANHDFVFPQVLFLIDLSYSFPTSNLWWKCIFVMLLTYKLSFLVWQPAFDVIPSEDLKHQVCMCFLLNLKIDFQSFNI